MKYPSKNIFLSVWVLILVAPFFVQHVETGVTCFCSLEIPPNCVLRNFTYSYSTRVSGTINGPCLKHSQLVPPDCFATFLVVQGLASNVSATPYFSNIAVGTLDMMTGVITGTAPYKGVFTVESVNFLLGADPGLGACLMLTASGSSVGAKVFLSIGYDP
ncbi:unnamed protein product [Gordionus sp. m RMFG-2023]